MCTIAQIIGTGKQRAAKTSRVTVGGTALTFASWESALTGEDYVTTNFESYVAAVDSTFDEGILGPIGCDIKFGGDWDAGKNPLDPPPGLYPRDDLAALLFYTSRLDVVFWNFPFARLRSATNGGEIAGKVTFAAAGKSQGRFFTPSGSV